MLQTQPWDPSIFAAPAAGAAASAPVVAGDPEAGRLLAEARSRIYQWPADFPGLVCDLQVIDGEDVYPMHLTARSSRELRLSGAGPAWVRFQVEELLSHREAPQVSRMHSGTGVVFGSDDALYGREIRFLGDPTDAAYRIRDRRITQIARTYKGTRLILNVDAHHILAGGYAAAAYTAWYWALDGSGLRKSEAYLDRYQRVQGLYLPSSRHCSVATQEGLRTRAIRFLNPRLAEV